MKKTIGWLVSLLTLLGCQPSSQSRPSTPPVAQPALHFLAIGDWGRRSSAQTATAAIMEQTAEQTDARFTLSVGDNFYESGVSSLADPQCNNTFEAVYQGARMQQPWYVVLGNHDYEGNPQAQIEYTTRSSRWIMPSRYFTFSKATPDGTPIRFVAIDTNPFISAYKGAGYSDLDRQNTVQQLRWLDSVLVHAPETWKIVIGHHPIYSVGPHGNEPDLISQLLPILTKNHVQAYLCGHSHDLQHIQQAGIDYVVTGAGTENLGVQLSANALFYDKTHTGFAEMAISRDSLHLRFIGSDGQVLYQMQRAK